MIVTIERLKEVLHYDPSSGAFRWRARRRFCRYGAGDIAGTDNGNYWIIRIDGEGYKAHRLAWFYTYGAWPKRLDHRDTDKLNNRLANLRLATNAQNVANVGLRANSMTGIKGVRYVPKGRRRKWNAQMTEKGKTRNLGWFFTAEEATVAYREAAQQAFGEFARFE